MQSDHFSAEQIKPSMEYRRAMCNATHVASLAYGYAAASSQGYAIGGATSLSGPYPVRVSAETVAGSPAPSEVDRQLGVSMSSTSDNTFRTIVEETRNSILAVMLGVAPFQEGMGAMGSTRGRTEHYGTQTDPAIAPAIESEHPWIGNVYALSQAGLLPKALRAMYWPIEEMIAKRNFFALNRIMSEFDISRIAPELIVGLIRATNRARLAIPSWFDLVERAKSELRARDVPDWERLFSGLTK